MSSKQPLVRQRKEFMFTRCKFYLIPVLLLLQMGYLPAQICGIRPTGGVPLDRNPGSSAVSGKQDLLNSLPDIDFFKENIKVNGHGLQLNLSLVPDCTLPEARDFFNKNFPESARYYNGSVLQVTGKGNHGGNQELSLIQLKGIPELILFTQNQPELPAGKDFDIPRDFKEQYWIPELAGRFVFIEYPMRNAKLLSFDLPEQDLPEVFQRIHEHLLVHQWQAGKQENLSYGISPVSGGKELEQQSFTADKMPLAPVYYHDRDQKLLLLFYRIDNGICRFSYYERPLQN